MSGSSRRLTGISSRPVERGAFREDLYYRLRRVVLTVPPLRERREDIPLLVEHVRRHVNARYGLAVAGVGKDALERLLSHTWPGNVRELEAVLEQAMIFQSSLRSITSSPSSGGWHGTRVPLVVLGRRRFTPRSSAATARNTAGPCCSSSCTFPRP